jgi:hypothetical protein
LTSFFLYVKKFIMSQKNSKGGVKVEKEIIVLDCGFDMDEVAGPMACCGGAFAPMRAY